MDYVFQFKPPGGPFSSVKHFHDWFARLLFARVSDQANIHDPYRSHLPDKSAITLTHGDLHRSNILISATAARPTRVVAIIDWAHAGWYPDYWEYCKSCYTSHYDDDWRKEHISKFLEPKEEDFDTFSFYCSAMGSV